MFKNKQADRHRRDKLKDDNFSVGTLVRTNPGLADLFVWRDNPWPFDGLRDIALHLGCGENVIDNFINIDFIPQSSSNVLNWNLLNPWPEDISGYVKMIYSEDLFEHFFYNEQMYILCSGNTALQDNGIFRILTPSLDALVNYSLNFSLEKNMGDWLVKDMGARTGPDALNLGMRFSGHRWLHNNESLGFMAKACGFEQTPAKCSESVSPEMCGLNLRDEISSSFANDLVKKEKISRLVISPAAVRNSSFIEEISADQKLYKADNNDPQIFYELPRKFEIGRFVLLNFRGVNCSQFREHSFAKIYFEMDEARSIYFDATLKSSCFSNILSFIQIQRKMQPDSVIDLLRFDPGEADGDYFTVGPLEIFFIPG